MAKDNSESLPMDDIPVPAEAEALLGDLLRNSSFLSDDEKVASELTEAPTDVEDEAPEESTEVTEDDDLVEVEDAGEEVEEEVEEVEEDEEVEDEDEDSAEEADTQEVDIYTLDDLDGDVQVTLKVDGEEVTQSLGDWLAGAATKQHLSKQGRELGDARKALEEEREVKFQELEANLNAANAIMFEEEQKIAAAYHEAKAKADKAVDDDDFDAPQLLAKATKLQEEYWAAHNKREGLVEAVNKQAQAVQAEQWNAQVENFYEEITNVIPDWTPEYNEQIKEFAKSEGISEEFLNYVVDPNLVRAMDDYRKLKQGVSKGTARRKKVATKKAPLKKAKPASVKKAEAAEATRARVMAEDATPEQQMEFLKSITNARNL